MSIINVFANGSVRVSVNLVGADGKYIPKANGKRGFEQMTVYVSMTQAELAALIPFAQKWAAATDTANIGKLTKEGEEYGTIGNPIRANDAQYGGGYSIVCPGNAWHSDWGTPQIVERPTVDGVNRSFMTAKDFSWKKFMEPVGVGAEGLAMLAAAAKPKLSVADLKANAAMDKAIPHGKKAAKQSTAQNAM